MGKIGSAATLLCAALIAVLPVGPSFGENGRNRSEPAKLAGVTTIVGDSTGYVRVDLTKSARFDLRERVGRASGPNTSVSIHGRGGFVGAVLVPDPPRPPALSENFLVVGRFGDCGTPVCRSRHAWNYVYSSEGVGWHGEGRKEVRLDPGTYRLYLITDEASARVSLHFRGLSGRALVRPKQDADLDLKRPDPIEGPNPATSRAWADVYRKSDRGLALSNLWIRTPADVGYDWATCSYKGETPPVSREAGFGPALCDNYWLAADAVDLGMPEAGFSSSGGFTPPPTELGAPNSHLTRDFNWTNGWRSVSHGGWVHAGGGIDKASFIVFFLSWN